MAKKRSGVQIDQYQHNSDPYYITGPDSNIIQNGRHNIAQDGRQNHIPLNGIINDSFVSENDLHQDDHNSRLEYYQWNDSATQDGGASDVQAPKRTEYRSLVPFCIVFGFGSLFSMSVAYYLSSQITVLERSFGLSSSTSGLLLGANDLGFVATVLISSHFLKNYHIPRILATCVLIFGISGVLTSLPHFLGDEKMSSRDSSMTTNISLPQNNLLCTPHVHGNNDTHIKKSCGYPNASGKTNGDNSLWVVIFIGVMMLIQGIAKAPRQALSMVYVDNNSENVKTGFYIGILSSFSIFGPFLAIVVGGLFNKVPVDLQETTLSPEDPRWIGAWWLGFIVFGACAIIASLPIFCFPASTKKTSVTEEPKQAEYINAAVVDKTKSKIDTVKELPISIIRVLRNPVYTSHAISALFALFAIMALGSFGPKYIENQFNVPTWKANIIMGVEKLITTVLGTFVGGILTRRLRLDMRGCLKMMTVARVIALVCVCFNFGLGCDRPKIIGFDIMSSSNSTSLCDCSGAPYFPVCADEHLFFSPCHAGCNVELSNNKGYGNCTKSSSGIVLPGRCDTGCSDFWVFVSLSAVGALFGTMSIAPSYVVVLRSVKESDRSIAVGLLSFLISLLVFLPAPIVYGKVFDSMCQLWSNNTCNTDKGACQLYDLIGYLMTFPVVLVEEDLRIIQTEKNHRPSANMRFKLVSIDVGLKAGCVLCTLLALFFAVRQARTRRESTASRTVEFKPPVAQPRVSLQSQHAK